MRYKVTPIYGNGWTDGINSIEEPLPFFCIGKESEGHIHGSIDNGIFGKAQFDARKRHDTDDGLYTCEVSLQGTEKLMGYCRIEEQK